MAAQAVAKVVVTGEGAVAASRTDRSTLTLPAGATRPQTPSTAAVVVFDQGSPERPKPYCTSDMAAEDARQQREQAQARERQSRAQAEAILRQRRAGGTEEDGEAMLIRPHRMIPIAFLSSDTLEAALCRQFADSHLIDRLWDRSQLNDWQYAVANRLLQLCERRVCCRRRWRRSGRSAAPMARSAKPWHGRGGCGTG
jgi:hypothetical protein